MLTALLRTPKTRPGLIAAVNGEGISRNYVYGWIAAGLRDGSLTVLKSTTHLMYQDSKFVVLESPSQGIYPTWLEPRGLPPMVGRRIYIDGRPV